MKNRKLGQFYTSEAISESIFKIVEQLSTTPPKNIVDFSVGDGALLKPFDARLNDCSIHAFDIDKHNIQQLGRSHPNWNIYNADSLLFNQEYSSFFDITVGNPPFIKTTATQTSVELFKNIFHYDKIKIGNSIRAEIQFLAKYIDATKDGGVLSIIVPESVISSEKNEYVRKALLKTLKQASVMEISGQYFDKAEVRTYLISGIKTAIPDKKITIGRIDEEGYLQDCVVEDKENCTKRLDFKFIKNQRYFKSIKSRCLTLGELTNVVTRGYKSKAQLIKDSVDFFHTTTFKEVNCENTHLQGNEYLLTRHNNAVVARKGDILIPRIGRSLHKSEALINSGNAVLSDSVFRIDAPQKYSRHIFESLQTDIGQKYRDTCSKGSCTKLLTIKDLMGLPLTTLSRAH